MTPKELRTAQARHDAAVEVVASLTADLNTARARIAEHGELVARVEALKSKAALIGADCIAAGIAPGDSSDWLQARKTLAAAQETLADSEGLQSSWLARIDALEDQIHDAKNVLKTAEQSLLEAQHDAACVDESAAMQAFLAAGDEFYTAHCALADAIDKRVKLRNRLQGLPAHTGGGYPVEVFLMPPEGATFTRDALTRRPPTALKGVA